MKFVNFKWLYVLKLEYELNFGRCLIFIVVLILFILNGWWLCRLVNIILNCFIYVMYMIMYMIFRLMGKEKGRKSVVVVKVKIKRRWLRKKNFLRLYVN